MRRDLDALEGTVFDVLVVGGGIYGACLARDAALRGLKRGAGRAGGLRRRRPRTTRSRSCTAASATPSTSTSVGWSTRRASGGSG